MPSMFFEQLQSHRILLLVLCLSELTFCSTKKPVRVASEKLDTAGLFWRSACPLSYGHNGCLSFTRLSAAVIRPSSSHPISVQFVSDSDTGCLITNSSILRKKSENLACECYWRCLCGKSVSAAAACRESNNVWQKVT